MAVCSLDECGWKFSLSKISLIVFNICEFYCDKIVFIYIVITAELKLGKTETNYKTIITSVMKPLFVLTRLVAASEFQIS